MRCVRVVIPRHEPLPGRYELVPCPKWCLGRHLRGQQPRKASFRPVRNIEAMARRCHGQGAHKAVAVAVSEPALNPRVTTGDAVAGIQQDVEVTRRRLMRVVEWHVAPPCQMTPRYYEAIRKE